jgi:Integrase core domain.
MNKKKFKKRR